MLRLVLLSTRRSYLLWMPPSKRKTAGKKNRVDALDLWAAQAAAAEAATGWSDKRTRIAVRTRAPYLSHNNQ